MLGVTKKGLLFGAVALLVGCGGSSTVDVETAASSIVETSTPQAAADVPPVVHRDGWHSFVAFYASPGVEPATIVRSFEELVERSDAIVLAEWGGPPQSRITTPRGEEDSSNPALQMSESIMSVRVLASKGLLGSPETLEINGFGVDAAGSPGSSDQALLFLYWRTDINQYRLFAGPGLIVDRESIGRVALNEAFALAMAESEYSGVQLMKKERLAALGDGVDFTELVRRAGLS